MAQRDNGVSAKYHQTHVVMGRIGACWGVKGWVKLFSFTDPLENILEYSRFLIEDGGTSSSGAESGLKPLEIDEVKAHGKAFVAHIKGCESREQTGQYTGCALLIPKSELPELDEGYYWHELEGLRVVTLAGEDLGVVHHMMETGANDVLVVHGDEASIDKEERLLPYLSGQVVTEVNLDQKVIRVDWDKDY